jgi:hypothetical protein
VFWCFRSVVSSLYGLLEVPKLSNSINAHQALTVYTHWSLAVHCVKVYEPLHKVAISH